MTIAVQKLPIDELCVQVTSGGTPSRKNAEYWQNGNINWLKTGELNDWYVGESEEKINQKGLDGSSAKLFPANTVLMAMYGDGKTITTLGVLNRPATTNQACCAMIVDGAKCNYLYLLYALKHHRNELLKLVVAGAQRNLSTGIIKKFPVTYFPLPKQERIADYLSSYDKLIENNRRRIQLLEESARLLYQEWFVQLRFPGHEQVKITDGIPEGWEKSSLENHILFSNGKAKKGSEEGSLPIYGANGIIGYGKNSLFNSGVVIGRVGAYCGSTMLALTKFWGSDNTIVAQASSERFGLYFLYFLLTKLDLNRFAGGAAQPLLTQTNLKKIEALFPAQQLCQEFDAFVRDIYSQINTLTEKNKKLGQARDLLLPKLMSGELTI